MSDYCRCCTTNVEHIRQHYDPDALTRPSESAEQVLQIFHDCCPDECDLTLADVKAYLDELERRP